MIRVETLSQLFDTALVLAYQPLPAGPRVAVVGNSSALGLLVGRRAARRAAGARRGDPSTSARPPRREQFAAAVAAALAVEGPDRADALVAVFVPPVAVPGAAYARALREAVAGSDRPVVAVFLAVEGVPAELAVPGDGGGDDRSRRGGGGRCRAR